MWHLHAKAPLPEKIADALIHGIPGVSPLAYIGTAPRTKALAWLDTDAGRFRLGGKKEAAGVAVAVIHPRIMDIECRFVIDEMLFGAATVAEGDGKR